MGADDAGRARERGVERRLADGGWEGVEGGGHGLGEEVGVHGGHGVAEAEVEGHGRFPWIVRGHASAPALMPPWGTARLPPPIRNGRARNGRARDGQGRAAGAGRAASSP